LLEDFGDEVVADAFDFVSLVLVLVIECLWKGQHTALWICTDDLDVGRMLPETAGDAGDCSSSSSTGDHHVDLPVGLLPDFLGGAEFVSPRVVRVRVLVEDVRIGDLLEQSLGHPYVRLRGVRRGSRWSSYDLGIQSAKNGDLLRRHLLWESDDCSVSCPA
jgi:hypothetical protein